MVHYFAILLFLVPIATTLGSNFWKDVDTLHNELLGHREIPTQSTTNETQPVESTPPAAHHSQLPTEIDENQSGHREQVIKKYYQKNVTVSAFEVENFKRTIIIDKTYPQNLSLEEIGIRLLLASESDREWHDLSTYNIDEYSKYWVKVCVFFWGVPLVSTQRYACVISSSFSNSTKRQVNIRNFTKYYDLLCCRCRSYEKNYKNNVSTPDIFQIHRSGENEYFIFEPIGPNTSFKLSIKGLKGGITLPIPADGERARFWRPKFVERQVTLNAYDIHRFYQALTIDRSYPKNISLAEFENKLKLFEDVHQWPTLQEYSIVIYSRYWAKVCVLFWSKNLDSLHRQSCIISPSHGNSRMRKLYIGELIQYFDLLCCKCHSYTTNCRNPLSAADTFLVHQISENEYFVFEQHATEKSNYTLTIKDYKGGITLPDPDHFND